MGSSEHGNSEYREKAGIVPMRRMANGDVINSFYERLIDNSEVVSDNNPLLCLSNAITATGD